MRHLLLLCILSAIIPITQAATWHVGPTRTYTYCSQVAPLVADGDTILIDYATYVNDPQVQWNKNNLYIAGIGGRPRLEAGDIIANDMSNGKGIFVTRGNDIHVHNIEFANARVQDNNGAGIRQEGAGLWVTNCLFDGNEMGILGGNIPNCKVTVEYCEFVNGGSTFNPGYQHNIYINHIDTLVFRYNYSHNSIAEGHEFKSRATCNIIMYNRIANEDSEDSRTIDIPNGGTSVVVGNVIEQGPNSANTNILGYGLEGLTNPAAHALYCANNTFINKKDRGSFIQVANGTETLLVKNNILAGAVTSGLINGSAVNMDTSNNWVNTDLGVFGFQDETGYDYHLLSSSPAIDAGIDVNLTILGYSLLPTLMYKDTCGFEERVLEGTVDIGAFEYHTPLATHNPPTTGIQLFPNPTQDLFYIQCSDAMESTGLVTVYTYEGAQIESNHIIAGRSTMDVSRWAPGLYIVVVSTTAGLGTAKLIVH